MSSRSFDEVPLHRLLGIRSDERGAGFVQYRVVPAPGSEGHADGTLRAAVMSGDAEGEAGVSTFAITTAVDIAVVDAVSTVIDRRRVSMNGTAELNLTYVDVPRGEARVRATVLHCAERVAAIEARVTDARGMVIAFGRGTYSLRPGGEHS